MKRKSPHEFKDELFERYLNLLGIQRQKPNLEFLKEIVQVQAAKIPFENISKLYYKKRLKLKQLIDFDLYLQGIEKFNFGGTCYSVNYYFNQLLSWLGYNVKLCGADMKSPDVHIVNIVTVDDREFLADVGYAAPFTNPLPLDLPEDYIIDLGTDRYILKARDKNNHSRIELYRNGFLKHTYKINPAARNIEEFKKIIADSFKGSSTFMNALLLARFETDYSLVINNMTIKETFGSVYKEHTLYSLDQLASLIEDRFGIPGSLVLETLTEIDLSEDAWN